MAVGNTASYGGGLRSPAVPPTDGLLDVVVGARMTRLTMMRIKPRLYQGTHVDHPLVTARRPWRSMPRASRPRGRRAGVRSAR
ncbi:hypothetical protein ACFQX7_35285 [Luedemannella flava]